MMKGRRSTASRAHGMANGISSEKRGQGTRSLDGRREGVTESFLSQQAAEDQFPRCGSRYRDRRKERSAAPASFPNGHRQPTSFVSLRNLLFLLYNAPSLGLSLLVQTISHICLFLIFLGVASEFA